MTSYCFCTGRIGWWETRGTYLRPSLIQYSH